MFYMQSNGSATLPRDFRFHNEGRPQTPEPRSEALEDPVPPSPPRPTRLKLRRRPLTSLQSMDISSVDIPMLTIEGPAEDMEMTNTGDESVATESSFRGRSPPRTPVPRSRPDGVSRRPDWSLPTKISRQYRDPYRRPSSVMSNASESSDDSFYSGSRLSRPSEDGTCTSPDSELSSPFGYPSVAINKGKAVQRALTPLISLNGNLRRKKRVDAPWSAAMDAHLWATYLLYLQDPTVTPFRMGTSFIPPEGVCHRVAREARRSWKGPKLIIPVRRSARLMSAAHASSPTSDKSGSLTPTFEPPKVYGQWPHSSGATRSHLRELCRSQGASLTSRHRHMQSPCPTPFSKNPRRHAEPARFKTREMAMSLTTSTAETMQADGPLAKLAAGRTPSPKPYLSHDGAFHVAHDHSQPRFANSARGFNAVGRGESIDAFVNRRAGFPRRDDLTPVAFEGAPGFAQPGLDNSFGLETNGLDAPRRLGSPFIAHTYGPSSSRLLQQDGSDGNARPRLRSPLRLTTARSLNNTQKRRAQHSLDEELSPRGAGLRPSILDEQLFGVPLDHQRRVRSRGFSLGSRALRNEISDPFLEPPQSIIRPTTPPNQIHAPMPWMNPPATPNQLAAPATMAPPARLRSPFAESGPSSTFPRRASQDATATIRRSTFATAHQSRKSIESFDFSGEQSMQSRLGDLDRRLQEIRDRESVEKNEK